MYGSCILAMMMKHMLLARYGARSGRNRALYVSVAFFFLNFFHTFRFGLHSGPVTAGVLRGERARFQLFGDTVNTASRMETTGERNRIQLSEQTAHILVAHGRGSWLQPREDKVEAKGKGTLSTFWLREEVASPRLWQGESERGGGGDVHLHSQGGPARSSDGVESDFDTRRFSATSHGSEFMSTHGSEGLDARSSLLYRMTGESSRHLSTPVHMEKTPSSSKNAAANAFRKKQVSSGPPNM